MAMLNRQQPVSQRRTSKASQPAGGRTAPFVDHVRELRTRVFWVAFVFMLGSVVAYQYRDLLIHVVMAPLGQQKLVYLTPGGGFTFIFQITMYVGVLLASPVLIFNLYKFVVPALPDRARRHTLGVLGASVALMVAGVLFGYLVAIPAAIRFLTTFASSYVQASLTADSYLNFVLGYVVGLGLLFQLPLVLVFWHWINPLPPKKLFTTQRYVVLFAFIAAAIITPTPDIVNQLLIAGPILVIYQVGVLAVLAMIHAERRRKRQPAKQPARTGSVASVKSAPSRRVAPDPQLNQLLNAVTVSNRPVTIPDSPYRPVRPTASVAVKPVRSKVPVVPSRTMSDFAVSRKRTRPVARPVVIPRSPASSPRPAALSIDGFSPSRPSVQ